MARVNLEDRFFSDRRLRCLAANLGWDEHKAVGVLAYLWHGSQEALRPSCGLAEVSVWTTLNLSESEKFIQACLISGYMTKIDGESDEFLIKGNAEQIESRISKIKSSSKGGESTKKRWELEKLKRATRHATRQATRPSEPGPVGLPGVGSIQCNSMQFNSDIFSPQDSPESEKENPNSEKPRNDRKDIQEFWEAYNQNRGSLPKAEKLTKGRIQKIKKRLEENPSLDYWKKVIKKLADSEFASSGTWCNIDWIICNDTNHVKAFEGKYDQKPKQASQTTVETRKLITFDDED